ncbi:MAG: helix-turn-helix domain-containing protein [Prolixibacteraceae bacterium]|jgi:DNA-binding HxlR family transcriptional regulator
MNERKISSSNYNNQIYLENRCTLNELLNLVSKRWMTEVLFCIEEGTSRFSGIKEDLKYISDTILADRLKILRNYGLIIQNDFHEVPPRIEYSLTSSGEELCNLLDQLCQFSENCMQMCGINSTQNKVGAE